MSTKNEQDEESSILHSAIENQRSTLADLRITREQLSALSTAIGGQDDSDGPTFERAARVARDLQTDLNEISRTISVVKKKLQEVKQLDAATMRAME